MGLWLSSYSLRPLEELPAMDALDVATELEEITTGSCWLCAELLFGVVVLESGVGEAELPGTAALDLPEGVACELDWAFFPTDEEDLPDGDEISGFSCGSSDAELSPI